MKKVKLDKYEQELLDSYERDEWKSVKNVKQEIKKHQEYVRNTLKKDKKINIRISSKELENYASLKALREAKIKEGDVKTISFNNAKKILDIE